MKKSIFTRVMMLAMMAVVSMTMLTACGGDDADSGGKEGGGTSSTFKYIVPYTQWGASSEKVAADMASIGWYKESETEKYGGVFTVSYSAPDESAGYLFVFGDNKLEDTFLAYNGYTEADFKALFNETEKVYGVKLEYHEASGTDADVYTGKATVNGRYSTVAVGNYKVKNLQMYVSITAY